MPQKNQSLAENFPDIFLAGQANDDVARIALTEDGSVAYASPAFCDALNLAPDRYDSIDIKTVSESMQNGESGLKALQPGEYPLMLAGQTQIFAFEWLRTPDKKQYFIGSAVATSKQKDKSRHIRHYGDLDLLSELSGDLMVVLGKDLEILRFNNAFGNLFKTHDGKSAFTALFSDEQANHILKNLGKPHSAFETSFEDKKNQTVNLSWIHAKKGTEHFLVARDISEIKRQQATFNDREKKLLQAESIGRMGHWRWDIGEEKVEWSEEIYRIFGVDESFKPTLDSIVKMVHKRDIPRANQIFQRAIFENNSYEMELRVLRPDGTIRYTRCEGRRALDEDGDAIALYGIMQDITERTLYEIQLREAKDAAERAYAAKSQFLTNMSHELRTPLNAIIGFSEMMNQQLLGPIGNEKYIEYVDGILQSGRHLLDLISDILNMSKIEAGKYDLSLEEMNVFKTLRMALHMIEGRAADAGIKLSIDQAPSEELRIVADRRGVMQILLNILSNAVKFTQTGGEIHIECLERPDYMVFKIRDTGIGIPANKLATITRPFEQVSHTYAREHEGSGLGLAITKELVEMHGGNLFIESTVGIGTTVTIRLPLDAYKATSATQS